MRCCHAADAVPLRFGDDSFLPHLAAAARTASSPDRAAARHRARHRHARRPGAVPGDAVGDAGAARCSIVSACAPTHSRAKEQPHDLARSDRARACGRGAIARRRHGARRLRRSRRADGGGRALRDRGHGAVVSYSRKVFIPLTQLCRDICHYCTFAQPPRRGDAAYLTPDEVLAIARAGEARRLQGGAVHAGRQARAAYQAARARRSPRSATTARSTTSPRCATLVLRRDRAAAARQSRRDERSRDRRAAPRVGVAGPDAGKRRRAAVRSAAGRTSARPTRCPAVRLATIAAAGELRCRSPPAS